jgi:hypothetical protein
MAANGWSLRDLYQTFGTLGTKRTDMACKTVQQPLSIKGLKIKSIEI